nr:fluoride export protein 2-like [Coffea arabica]XP_027068235.1 fluoride export protein 2-like [Coffea arabica]XP_027068236.1 fluoride export protein 2-like [Coffea arabica]XP_027068238.1 fluoride export protein 2-like [Coffea arabica]XP_027072197.1 fluoride export protein 2-like [Coffea arabica]XP_027072198.1 fluoride export protein 2-like [Coffea arabica]XP_027072199.1 fluoride export protein 2-like [Coffea arabica]
MRKDREEMTLGGPRRSKSLNRASSVKSSLRRHSFGSFHVSHNQGDDDTESEAVSEAGDIGDRALHSRRSSESGRGRISIDNVVESGVIVPILEDASLQPTGFSPHKTTTFNTESALPSSTLDIALGSSADGTAQLEDKKNENEKAIPWILEYISCLSFLALFGILGVITRFYLQKLFGPRVIGATSDQSYMYPDLPSNMVGSFLMGWFGVVFKGDISEVSDNLAIGLTTGFLGSLTTFSGWNQKMLDLSVRGHWVFAILGILIGLFLAAYSIIFGIETAKGFKWLKKRFIREMKFFSSIYSWDLDQYNTYLTGTVVLLLILGVVWGVCIAFTKKQFYSDHSHAELLLGCIVGPFGVWIRWFLARLNGRGLGKKPVLRWVPFGTLAANILAAAVMAALATLKKAVNTDKCNTVATGIQLGFLGCLSTVSTFIAEFNAMRQSSHTWRAYAYATSTIVISFALGTLIYSVPVWVKGYD